MPSSSLPQLLFLFMALMSTVILIAQSPTLTTVLLVSVYRTAASLEAAWKYFILGSVGIALALTLVVAPVLPPAAMACACIIRPVTVGSRKAKWCSSMPAAN